MAKDRSTVECTHCRTVYLRREGVEKCRECGSYTFKPSHIILEGSFPRTITIVNGKPVYGPEEA
jgi:hypothetical protein